MTNDAALPEKDVPTKSHAHKLSPFLRFLITGGIAAGVNLVSRYILSMVMPFEVAVILAYLFGMLTAYVLARLYVFKPTGDKVRRELFRFALVNVAAAAQVWGISVGLARLVFPALSYTWYPEDVAHLIGVIVPAITSYLGHKHFSFAGRKA